MAQAWQDKEILSSYDIRFHESQEQEEQIYGRMRRCNSKSVDAIAGFLKVWRSCAKEIHSGEEINSGTFLDLII